MNAKEVRARLQECARAVQAIVGKDVAFALLVFADDDELGGQRTEYVSNGKREDVWRGVAEWVMKTSHKPVGDS